ncbi:hypothetical protein BUALT_Bualt12G0035100 [Buddleja alternifolia]|uniref:F-box domain-containing protein n=1 Tax=Buddleja alternifolia TaxID=168488 RepID=A0AAV6WWU7_9LAMI|nr:hypothetical protein BUALT_Bualt12G0035100 [Buddleja alternifolia]
MLFFLISCFSFLLLLSQSFLKPNPTPKIKSRMHTFPFIFYQQLHKIFLLFSKKRKIFIKGFQVPIFISNSKPEIVEKTNGISLLDLPDLPLDSILEKLSPAELLSMAGVCTSLRERGKSDHLWEKHLNEKWGGIIGNYTYKEWHCQIASRRAPKFLPFKGQTSKFQFLSSLLDFFLGYKSEMKNDIKVPSLPVNSIMSLYLALESGKFWFPAQVFNRENGHVGFMLSCYDAHLSYDSTTDNFVARYPCQGRSMIEEDIKWNRIRAPSVDTPPNVLHISDCLNELKPDDHIEIQWRKNKEFPYGWWYGVVGHLDSCSGNQFNCNCHISDSVILEFKQYSSGSKWRRIMISRKDHKEVGNEEDGFYGGIRKLYKKQEIAKWQQLWPNCPLE